MCTDECTNNHFTLTEKNNNFNAISFELCMSALSIVKYFIYALVC